MAVQNRFEELEGEGIMDKWNILKEAMVTSATEVLPKKERQRKAAIVQKAALRYQLTRCSGS